MSMQILHTIDALRAALGGPGQCAFVPTMGNLHEGHLSLVRKAKAHGLPVVVSIFVNRLQFAPNEDFDQYPRTLARDADLLRGAGADFVFAPSESELYPEPQTYKITPAPELADILEGHFRPGFFTGVCTVVMKLFQCVQPQVAVFGKKDYQQLMVIQHMVRQFAMPILVEGADTQRADDGLALSSRNGYLDPVQRERATALAQALQSVATQVRLTPDSLPQIEAEAMAKLTAAGWQPDYLCVRRRSDLLPPLADELAGPLVVLGAARIGSTRLIDNLEF